METSDQDNTFRPLHERLSFNLITPADP